MLGPPKVKSKCIDDMDQTYTSTIIVAQVYLISFWSLFKITFVVIVYMPSGVRIHIIGLIHMHVQ